MCKRPGSIALAAFGLAAIMLAATAQGQPGFYAGASIGSSDFELDDGEVATDDIGYKVFGGYDFNRYFAIELAYFDGGTLIEDIFDLTLGVSGFIGSAVGSVPLGDSFALFAKLGYAAYDVDVDSAFLGLQSEADSDSDLAYGAGLAVRFAERWEIRVEYEALDLSEGADFSMTSVSGLYRF